MQAKAEAVVADPDAGKFCYGLPGSIAPIENFDPAGFLKDKTKAEVYTLREAELTHGRVGMLAALGFLVQEWWHPLFGADGGPASGLRAADSESDVGCRGRRIRYG
jgi:hypothetical protein